MVFFLGFGLFKFLYSDYFSQDKFHSGMLPQQALSCALNSMNVYDLKLLLDQGIDINRVTEGHLHPLQYVLRHRFDHPNLYEVVKLLVEAKANVVQNDREWTALHQAVRIKNVSIIQLLLESGAPVNKQDSDGRTPLYHACSIGFAQGVEKLLAYGACVRIKDKKDLQPLHVAAGKCRVNWSEDNDYPTVIEMLIKHGAHINARDRKGRTALHFAAMRGCDLVVASLLNHGASPHVIDFHRAQPVHYASGKIKFRYARKESYFTIVNRLALSGSPLDRVDKDGKTPLHYAASIGNDLIVDFLVDEGVRVNSMDNQGAVPMHYAFGKDVRRFVPLRYHDDFISIAQIRAYSKAYNRDEESHCKIILKLLEHGAQSTIKDYSGRTPLTYAIKYNHQKLRDLVV